MTPAVTTPRPGRRPAHNKATLVNCAVEAFIERGYEGTSMEHLADRLGITKSSIYHHVMGKAELYTMALDEAGRLVRSLVGLAAAQADGDADRLRHLVRSVLLLPCEELRPLELLLSVRDSQEEAPGALERRHQFEVTVETLVRGSMAQTKAAPEVPAAVRTRLVLDLLRSLLVQRRLGLLPTNSEAPDVLADLVTGCVR